VLAMLIFGMLQYGLAFFQLQNLRAATREGARIGAVGASVTQIKQRVADASLGALPANSAAVNVYYTSDGVAWGAPLTSGNGCPPKGSQTINSQVRVALDLNSASLPPTLQNIFVVDIPLMPPISLKGATISGVFRCEGN
jgi:Flp pilus assembly protein TadG